MDRKLRIAFVKFAGLAAGGTERWLQMMAANLPRDRFDVDYFYCAAAPYVDSDYRHADTDPARAAYMRDARVNLIEFHVGAKDVTTPTHDWVDTDFWERFDPDRYDLVQTAKAGPAEYPYHLLPIPVVEFITLSAGVDRGPTVARTIHLSQWQRREWIANGGAVDRSEVIPIPAEPPVSADDLRAELELPPGALVAGFHQRADDLIFSPIPLDAFAATAKPDRFFLVMGGSDRYRRQAADLGLTNVRFLDHRGDATSISRFLNTLDVFAHGRGDGETFGTVFAEAMAHGRACLSHRSPIANAQPETMGPAGLFAQDADEYGALLERLWTDDALRRRLASKAVPHARRYYSVQTCVQRLAGVYENVLEGRQAAIPGPTPYGWSDLGLLLAGDLENPHAPEHSVLTGGIPDEPVVSLLRRILRNLDSLRILGGRDQTVALVGAADATVGCAVVTSGASGPLPESLSLNNWEDRVEIVQLPTPAELSPHHLGGSRELVSVDSAQWLALLLGILEQVGAPRPPLLARLDAVVDRERLEELGYRSWRIGSAGAWARPRPARPGWHLFVARDHDGELARRVDDWNAERLAARRRELRALFSPRELRGRVFRMRLMRLHAREAAELRRQAEAARRR